MVIVGLKDVDFLNIEDESTKIKDDQIFGKITHSIERFAYN